LLAENSSDVIWVLDLETQRFRYISPSVERLRGYTAEEVMAQDMSAALTPDSLDYLLRVLPERMARFRAGEQSEFTDEIEQPCKDGATVWTEVATHYRTNEETGHLEVFGTSRNIAERKRAESALRLQTSALKAAANGIVITDAKGQILWVNPAFSRLTGYTAAEAIGQSTAILKSGRHDREFYAAMWNTIRTGKVWQGELVNRRKDGSHYHEEMIITPVLDRTGRIEHFVAVQQDVSQRKEAEQRIAAALKHGQLLLEASPVGIITFRATGEAVAANPAIARMFGATRDQVVAQNFRELESWKRSGLLVAAETALATGQPQRLTTRHLSTFGRELWLESEFVPFDHEGEPHLLGLFIDTTERQQAESRQQLSNEILHTLNRGGDLRSLMRESLRLIKERTGLDAAGLRLRQGEDCTYFEQNGFAEDFIREENSLCARGGDGAILRDAAGQVVLECACGLVASGRTDPTRSCFTEGGSFWTSDSPELLALAPADDPRTNPRYHCIHHGYRSVALIPLRAGGEILGLLQLNDRQAGRFNPEAIRFFEGLATSIGLAFKRAQAEEQLAAERDVLSAMLDNMPDYIYFKDRESRFVRCSRELVRLFKAEDVQQLLGKTDFDFYAADRARAAFEDEQEIIRTGQPIVGKLEKGNHLDGGVSWVLTTKMPWRDKTGGIIGTFGISKNVTAIKEAESKLALEEILFRALLDGVPDFIYFKDAQCRYTRVNAAQARLLGLRDPAEAIGKSDMDFLPGKHWRQTFADEQRICVTGESLLDVREQIQTHDGKTIWISSTKVTLRDADGNITGLVGVSRDITERVRQELERGAMESRYHTLFETASDAIMTLGGGGYLDGNQATLKMFACASKSEFISAHPGDLSPPAQPDGTDSKTAANLRIMEAFKRGTSRFEWVHRRRNGEDFPAEVTFTALSIGDQRVLQATVRDLTEARRAEKERQSMEVQLRQ
jgi:PAS domain S-box-containing protein